MKKEFEKVQDEKTSEQPKKETTKPNLVVAEFDNFQSYKRAKKRKNTIKFIARVGIFSAISAILYLLPFPPFKFSIFPAVAFLEVNFSEVPAMIAGFAYGPLAGFLVIVLRFLIKLPLSNTGFIGEFADLMYSSALVVSSAIIYSQSKTFKNAIIAIVMGGICHISIAIITNFYFIIDWYNVYYGGHLISETFTKDVYLSWNIPFNVIKNIIVSVVTLLTYKRVHRLMDKI